MRCAAGHPGDRARPARTGPARVALVLLAAAVATVTALALAPGASAGAGESVGGTIREPDGTGVEGVVVEVRDDDGPVGRATTAAEGSWSVPVPGPGTYEVELDDDTLPDDVSLRDPDRRVLEEVDVRSGQAKVVLFPLGEADTRQGDRLARLANLAVDGLKLGTVVAVAAVGLSLVFGVTGLVNFAHGELVTFGAVVAFLLSSSAAGPGWPLVGAAVVTTVIGGAFGLTLERGLWRPLRRRRTGTVALLVVSIGLSLFLRHVILAAFDGAPRQYAQYTIQQPVELGPISVLPKEVAVIGISLAVLVAVGLLLQRTRLGTAIRAVADNPDLAETSGVDVDRVLLATWVAAAALSALGGVLYGLLQAVVWDMGFTLLLTMFAAVLLGGLGSAYGAMAGGLLVGLASEMSTYWIPVELKAVVALLVLVAVLLVRPQGLLGVRERIA